MRTSPKTCMKPSINRGDWKIGCSSSLSPIYFDFLRIAMSLENWSSCIMHRPEFQKRSSENHQKNPPKIIKKSSENPPTPEASPGPSFWSIIGRSRPLEQFLVNSPMDCGNCPDTKKPWLSLNRGVFRMNGGWDYKKVKTNWLWYIEIARFFRSFAGAPACLALPKFFRISRTHSQLVGVSICLEGASRIVPGWTDAGASAGAAARGLSFSDNFGVFGPRLQFHL